MWMKCLRSGIKPRRERDAREYSRVAVCRGFCVLTKLMHMKLSNPCCATLFGPTLGNVLTELPPKCVERSPRLMESLLTSSSIVIGKISSPIFESLVKTVTSSKDFLSFFKLVYGTEERWDEDGVSYPTAKSRIHFTFLITASALATSWSGSSFTTGAGAITLMAPSGIDGSDFTGTDATLFLFGRGGTSTQNICRFAGRGLG